MIRMSVDRIDVLVNYFCLPVAIFLLCLFDLFVYFFYTKSVLSNVVEFHIFIATLIIVIESSIAGKLFFEYCIRKRNWRKLITDAKSSDLKIQAMALAQICKLLMLNDQKIKHFFIENGVVSIFVASLKSTNDSVQGIALIGLQNVSLDSTKQAQIIVDAKAVPTLVKMLESKIFKLNEQALSVLCNLTKAGSTFYYQCVENELLTKLQKFVVAEAWLEHACITAKFLSDFCTNTSPYFSDESTPNLVASLLSKLLQYPDKKVLDDALFAMTQMIKNGKTPSEIVEKIVFLETIFSPSNNKIATTQQNSDKIVTSPLNETGNEKDLLQNISEYCDDEPPKFLNAKKDIIADTPLRHLSPKLLQSISSINSEVSCEKKFELNHLSGDLSNSEDDQSIQTTSFAAEAVNGLYINGSYYGISKSMQLICGELDKFFSDEPNTSHSAVGNEIEPLKDDEKVENSHGISFDNSKTPITSIQIDPELAKLQPDLLKIGQMISEVAVKNEKFLKDLFLNCCNTLTLSNPEIKMECLECIYTAIGDIAENNISNINIQTIIDSNLYDILDNLYLMDDDEKVQAKAKEVLEKLKSVFSSDNVPEELAKTDEVIISKDIHPGSEYDGDHESLPEKESLPRLTNDNEYTSDQDYEADFKILHLL